MKKLLIGLAAAVLFSGAVALGAEDNVRPGIGNAVAGEGTVSLYVQGVSWEEGQEVSDIKATCGRQEMKVASVQPFTKEKEPVFYQCLVDVSGSMDEERMEQVRRILLDLAEKSEDGHRFNIVKMGDDITPSGFLSDRDEIEEAIHSLSVTHEDTNMYGAISSSVKELLRDKNIRGRRYLLIFSDGAEDNATGITRQEAEKAIVDSHIPVFTVAMLKKRSNNNELESAKVLGSFARQSLGGVHYTPTLEGYDYGEIPYRLTEDMDKGIVVTVDLGEMEAGGSEAVFSLSNIQGVDSALTYQVDNDTLKSAVEAGKKAREAREKEEAEKAKKAEETKKEETPVEKEMPEKEESVDNTVKIGSWEISIWVIIGIAAVIIILIIVIAIVLMAGKSKEAETMVSGESREHADAVSWESADMASAPAMSGSGAIAGGVMGEKEEKKGVPVHLVRMGIQEDAVYDFYVDNTYSIGRDLGKNDLAISDDTALSGCHCILSREGKKLYVKDKDSTNGTFVNGVPIQDKHELAQDDTILMGSFEYRIFWSL